MQTDSMIIIGILVIVLGTLIVGIVKILNLIRLSNDEYSEKIAELENNIKQDLQKNIAKLDTLNELVVNSHSQASDRMLKIQEETLCSYKSESESIIATNKDNHKSTVEVLKQFLESKINGVTLLLEETSSKESEFVQEQFKQALHSVKDINELIEKQSTSLKKEIESNYMEAARSLQDMHSKETALIQELLDQAQSDMDNLKKLVESSNSSLEQNAMKSANRISEDISDTQQLIHKLRLDNLINITNELGKHVQGSIEDDNYVKDISYYRVLKITDKVTNEITSVHYDEHGNKTDTETHKNGKLKYSMKYNNNILKQGHEYDDEGRLLFEYEYDEVGEISKKIEYSYDTSGKITDEKETDYRS